MTQAKRITFDECSVVCALQNGPLTHHELYESSSCVTMAAVYRCASRLMAVNLVCRRYVTSDTHGHPQLLQYYLTESGRNAVPACEEMLEIMALW